MSIRLSDDYYDKYMQIMTDSIRFYRKLRGLTQDTLSERMGSASKSYISKIESRQADAENPTIKVIFSIAEQLHVTPADLFRDRPKEENRGQLLLTAYNMLKENMDLATIHRNLPDLTMSEIEALQKIASLNSKQK